MPSQPDSNFLATRHTLLERVRNRDDKESWNEFINYYDQYIYNILRHKKISPEDAEEMCQDIILKLWKHMPDFVYKKDRGKFRSWLGTIIRNDVSDYYTKLYKKQKQVADESELENIEDPIDVSDIDTVIKSEWMKHISALAWESIKKRFEENTQKAFMLHLKGKSAKAIADECGIKENTVYVYIQRVEIHLKQEIKQFNNDLL